MSETEEERERSRRVPRELYNTYTEEYREASSRVGQLCRGPRFASSLKTGVHGDRVVRER